MNNQALLVNTHATHTRHKNTNKVSTMYDFLFSILLLIQTRSKQSFVVCGINPPGSWQRASMEYNSGVGWVLVYLYHDGKLR